MSLSQWWRALLAARELEAKKLEAERQAAAFVLERTGQLPRVDDGVLYVTREQYDRLVQLYEGETLRRFIPGNDRLFGIPVRVEEP